MSNEKEANKRSLGEEKHCTGIAWENVTPLAKSKHDPSDIK